MYVYTSRCVHLYIHISYVRIYSVVLFIIIIMALDRFAELTGGGTVAVNNDMKIDRGDDRYIDEEGQEDQTLDGNSINRYWQQVRYCQTCMKTVRMNMQRQVDIKYSFKEKVDKNSEKSLMDEFEKLNKDNSKYCVDITSKIKSLEEEYKKSQQEAPDEPETRMKEAQIVSLTSQISDLMRESQTVSIDFKQIVKDKLKRQIRNVDFDNKISEQQIDRDIEKDPDIVYKLVEQQLVGKAHLKVENAVRDIEEKCKGIELLHDNVRKLYELIKEISDIVHQQGEQVDLILKNVNKSKDYVEKGNKNLMKAKDYHQKARKKQCCIILIAVIFLCILLAPVLTTIIN